MKTLRRWSGMKLSSDGFDARLAQYVFFAGALGILVCSVLKMAKLGLSETELFFGLLLTVAVMLLMILMGFVVALPQSIKKSGRETQRVTA